MTEHLLRYLTPATNWNEALPLGNGTIGAMCFGDAKTPFWQLNDETLWSGGEWWSGQRELVHAEEAQVALAEAREAVLCERYEDADAAVKRLQHSHSQSYLPLADMSLTISTDGGQGHVLGYARQLDLRAAEHSVRATIDGVGLTQLTWVSRPHGVLVHEIVADADVDVALELDPALRRVDVESVHGGLTIAMRAPADVVPPVDATDDPVTYEDGVGTYAAVHAEMRADGRAVGTRGRGRHFVIVLSTATTFRRVGEPPTGGVLDAVSAARSRVSAAWAVGAQVIRRVQREDHARLYDRVELHLPDGNTSDTGTRLDALNRSGEVSLTDDPGLAALLFHYGRYLLICSSRPGGLPANLQGIWNADLRPMWSSNYTTNINLQMNYWLAHTTNLGETEEPLVDLVEALAVAGRETARRLYGADGWVAHHNTDAWAYTEPVGQGEHDPRWAFWPMGGLWLCMNLADRMRFGLASDEEKLRMFPVIRSAAEFAIAWLVRLPNGNWGTNPSTSPENTFRTKRGSEAATAHSSTLDLVLIKAHLRFFVELATEIAPDDELVAAARRLSNEITEPVLVDGTISEWGPDLSAYDASHRHLSPLVFIHPGVGSISHERQVGGSEFLDRRGEEATGWSLVWKVLMRARLQQPERVDSLLGLVFRDMKIDRGDWIGGLYPNLLAAHPPFQIDGNLGYTAAIAECLVQSHRGRIELLPAVPTALADGEVTGLVARPGVSVDMRWQGSGTHCEVLSATFRALHPQAVGDHIVAYPGGHRLITLRNVDSPVTLDASD